MAVPCPVFTLFEQIPQLFCYYVLKKISVVIIKNEKEDSKYETYSEFETVSEEGEVELRRERRICL